MQARRFQLLALLVAVATFASWFVATNQCALGFIAGGEKEAACDPAACGTCADEPQPADEGGRSPRCLARCHELRFALPPDTAPAPMRDALLLGEIAQALVAVLQPAVEPKPVTLLRLDTGPPFALSFAEIVLGESLFSHAPPRRA